MNQTPTPKTEAEKAEYRLETRRMMALARKMEWQRARALNAHDAHDPAAPDLGPSGEAFATRPYTLSQQGAVSRGSVAPGRVIEVKRMTDTCLIDRMHGAAQLSDRQHQAAKMLWRMHTPPRVTGRLPYVSECVQPDDEPGEDGLSTLTITLDDGETWADRLRRILRGFGSHQADLLMDLIQDRHPGVRWLATVQECLGRLADEWGFER